MIFLSVALKIHMYAEVNLAGKLWASPIPKKSETRSCEITQAAASPPPLSALPLGYQVLFTILLLETHVFSDWIMCWGKKEKKGKQLVPFTLFCYFTLFLLGMTAISSFIMSLAIFTFPDPTSRLDSCFGHILLMHSTALSYLQNL